MFEFKSTGEKYCFSTLKKTEKKKKKKKKEKLAKLNFFLSGLELMCVPKNADSIKIFPN